MIFFALKSLIKLFIGVFPNLFLSFKSIFKFNLPIKRVIESNELSLPYLGEGILCNSLDFNGKNSAECKKLIIERLSKINAGYEKISFKLRDWVFSRQRYWGEPIPIYFPVEIIDKNKDLSPIDGAEHIIRYDQPIAVDEECLPLNLPELINFEVFS